ncbi:hypothetical protein F4678DRAFT_81488 [Xylaria arbuscula]|nr:hypothetical protein F4678DRAFT_81488 [Xylaria arbuscula]
MTWQSANRKRGIRRETWCPLLLLFLYTRRLSVSSDNLGSLLMCTRQRQQEVNCRYLEAPVLPLRCSTVNNTQIWFCSLPLLSCRHGGPQGGLERCLLVTSHSLARREKSRISPLHSVRLNISSCPFCHSLAPP